jgi:uncharacterized protein YihD (DUF1040 family)
MLLKLVPLSVAVGAFAATPDELWKKAEAEVQQVEKRFADIKSHAQDVGAGLEEAKEQALESARPSLKQGSVPETVSTSAKSAFAQLSDSSFLEIPESLAKFPKVAEDLEQLKEAEAVYNAKMKALHEQDDALLALANKDFEDSSKAAGMIGNLRRQHERRHGASSFIETGALPDAFQRVLKAEADLEAANDKLAREFHLV